MKLSGTVSVKPRKNEDNLTVLNDILRQPNILGSSAPLNLLYNGYTAKGDCILEFHIPTNDPQRILSCLTNKGYTLTNVSISEQDTPLQDPAQLRIELSRLYKEHMRAYTISTK